MTSKYPHFLCPGPTITPQKHLSAYSSFLGSSDIQAEFNTLYDKAEGLLLQLLNAPETSSAVIMSGEGMLALWAALSSLLNKGDKVLAINFGVYGKGIGEMAEGKGGEVEFVSFPADQPLSLSDCAPGGKLFTALHQLKPKLITLVHCETPTGVIVPEEVLDEIGRLSRSIGALLYVDMVSSAGGVNINLTNNSVDLALIGSQKCLSLPPDLSIIIVSDRAWREIQGKYDNPQTRYIGYDSLYSFKDAVLNKSDPGRIFPYTMNWNAIQALVHCLEELNREGFDRVFDRHISIAKSFILSAKELGFKLFVKDENYSSPTVTALYVPDHTSFTAFDKYLREKGVIVGGSYGEFEGKIFRVGHMGSQANTELINSLVEVLRDFQKSSPQITIL